MWRQRTYVALYTSGPMYYTLQTLLPCTRIAYVPDTRLIHREYCAAPPSSPALAPQTHERCEFARDLLRFRERTHELLAPGPSVFDVRMFQIVFTAWQWVLRLLEDSFSPQCRSWVKPRSKSIGTWSTHVLPFFTIYCTSTKRVPSGIIFT